MTSSQDLGLAENEVRGYEFIVKIVIWHEVFFVVNLLRKIL
jgi:hypothetical protein